MNKYYKTSRAYDSLKDLPNFLSKSTESALYNLINIPNIELDRVNYDLLESTLNVVPTTTNLSLPPYIYEITIEYGAGLINPSSAIEALSLHQFTFGDFTGTRALPPSSYDYITEPVDFNNLSEGAEWNDTPGWNRWFNPEEDASDSDYTNVTTTIINGQTDGLASSNHVLKIDIIDGGNSGGDVQIYSSDVSIIQGEKYLLSVGMHVDSDVDLPGSAIKFNLIKNGSPWNSYTEEGLVPLWEGTMQANNFPNYTLYTAEFTANTTASDARMQLSIGGHDNLTYYISHISAEGETAYNNQFDISFDGYLDVHYLSPLFYLDSDNLINRLDEGYAALKDGDNYFKQSIDIFDIKGSKVNSTLLPTRKQNLSSASEDEWMYLDENNQYTIDRPAVKNVQIVHVHSTDLLLEGLDFNYVDLEH